MISSNKRATYSITELVTTNPKRPCLEHNNLNFVINLINQWDFAAKNKIDNTHLRMKLYKKTQKAAINLEQIERSSSVTEKGKICILALNKFNSLSCEDLTFIGEWIASNSSSTTDVLGAYCHFTKFIQTFKKILVNPEVHQYVKGQQMIELKYAQITETAETTIDANKKGFPFNIDLINHINSKLDWTSSLSLTTTSQHHYNVRRLNLINKFNQGSYYRRYTLYNIKKLFGDLTSKVKKLTFHGDYNIDDLVKRFPALESLTIQWNSYNPPTQLTKLSKLTDLNLEKSAIQSLDVIKHISLTSLDLSECKNIKDFQALENCTSLTSLNLSKTLVINFNFSNTLSSLKDLTISSCAYLFLFKQKNENKHFEYIQSLNLSNNTWDINSLSCFPNLTAINLKGCDLRGNETERDILHKFIKSGKVIYPNGDEFVGTFYENVKEGMFILNSGYRFEGRFLNEPLNILFECVAKRICEDTITDIPYNVVFTNGPLDGVGMITFPDGTNFQVDYSNLII